MNLSAFPELRMRRLRRTPFVRDLVRESQVNQTDLIQPIYVLDGRGQRQPVVAMPGVSRVSIDLALEIAAECVDLGIPAVALHPVLDAVLRNSEASEAVNPDGLMPRAIRAVKEQFPRLGVMTEVSLAPYTVGSQASVRDANGREQADDTLAVMVRQALLHASAGADFLVLGDAIDGQVAAIRSALEREGLGHVCLVTSPANYASAFHGPYGEHGAPAVDRIRLEQDQHLLDPANADEALRGVAHDLADGADIIVVKPGLPYLDILHRIKRSHNVPVFAFQASGEYAMLKAAAQNGWVLHDRVMMEWITAFKRAGADAVFTFFAREIARQLGKADAA